jgi:hypothetical protein
MRTIITIAALVIAGVVFGAATYSVAYAGGPGALVSVGAFNPLDWPWADVAFVLLSGLGALAAFLRVLAPRTKSTVDDRLLTWVDKLAAFLARIIVPGKYREALVEVQKLGLGTGKGGVGDQPYPPPPPPFSSGGKSGGDAA